MQIAPFRIEEYFGKYEFTAKYLLSSSDCQSQTIADLLAFEPGAHDAFLKHWCGYTETPGAPWLRETIAQTYKGIRAADVFVVAAAEEAIFLFYHALLKPGDHAIVESPCYESALTLVKSTGATLSEWRRKPENGWAHDLAALESLIHPDTRSIYINTPHNPTGLLIPLPVLRSVMQLAGRYGIYVFCDEVYRELEHDSATRLPAGCELYERAVSLGSMSKTYGLAGLRLGWLVSREPKILQLCTQLKYYTTICSSAPSEYLTDLAIRHREKIIGRNLQFVLHNAKLLSTFLARRSDLFSWTPPTPAPSASCATSPPSRQNQTYPPMSKLSAKPSSSNPEFCCYQAPFTINPTISASASVAATCPNLSPNSIPTCLWRIDTVASLRCL
jgi:aspartate/methionine/tyrosine aminotransferase